MMSGWSYYPHYEPTRRLPVERGIAARSRRGAIGETWWSQRFIALLESFGVGSRLKRGRNYARSGQVAELEVEPGIVLAEVQGSRYTPYRVRIRAKVLSEHQWRRAEKAMAAQALPLAKLLAGEMPHDIEDVLGACKLTLFPSAYRELTASCTCPDVVNPCKHIAAGYYILAERFDEDPFLIFAWRGRTQEELLERLRARRGGATQDRPEQTSRRDDDAQPLSALVDCFWSAGPALADLRVSPLASAAPDSLLRRLGPAPAESGGRNVADLLARIPSREDLDYRSTIFTRPVVPLPRLLRVVRSRGGPPPEAPPESRPAERCGEQVERGAFLGRGRGCAARATVDVGESLRVGAAVHAHQLSIGPQGLGAQRRRMF